MSLFIDERESDSPFIERVWRSRSEDLDNFISVAIAHCDLVFWTQHGKTQFSIQGPESKASRAPVPPYTEFFGIVLKMGTFLTHFPTSRLVDSSVTLPEASGNDFWLHGQSWQLPTYDNAETFVARLVRAGTLVHEPIVETILCGHMPYLSTRSIQRRFLYAVGQSYRTIQQIERARHAAVLLRQGVSILDTVYQAGYFDQPHLNRALKRFIGQTPAQLRQTIMPSEQLSLLYKTRSLPLSYDAVIDFTR